MNGKALDKIAKELERFRRSRQKPAALKRLAKRLGRKLRKGGKHPMWRSEEFGHLYDLSIPQHPGDVPIGTQNSILDQLEEDVLAWEEKLKRNGSADNGDGHVPG